MASETAAAAPAAKRRVGRPRRLSLEAILDAACEIGLEQLDMAQLAARLNTGVATLYSYVRGRDHLFQLVSERLAVRAQVVDRGQGWQDLLREHAAMASGVFATSPQLITNLISGSEDGRKQIYSRRMIGMLIARGFAQDAAIGLYVEVTQLLIGAALCAERARSLGGVSKLPNGQTVPLPERLGDYRPTLERLIRDHERGADG